MVLWIPVAIGAGIAAWFVLPDRAAWIGWMLGCGALSVVGVVLPIGGRAGRVLSVGGLALALGCALVWWRADAASAPVLARPAVVTFDARVERVEALAARDLVRLTLAPLQSSPDAVGTTKSKAKERVTSGSRPREASANFCPDTLEYAVSPRRRGPRATQDNGLLYPKPWAPACAGAHDGALQSSRPPEDATGPLPPRVRVNLAEKDVPEGLTRGAVIRLRARLMPPPTAAVPGAYDYARVAWFAGIGATGRGFAPVTIVTPGEAPGSDLRARLSRHIQSRIDGAGGAVAASLATGDQGGIPEEDAEAMRRSGLAHLLSVSGLHITAVVGATMVLVLRLLALSPWMALNLRLPVIAAGAGAVAAVGYTWLTGGEVPTIRSCVAALLVLAALALGREAITLRLVATGALVVILLWPEAVVGASFQLSFAAVTAIVALHEGARVRGAFAPREEHWSRRMLRGFVALLATGIAVEFVLMPIGLFHFHKAGLYGALANIVAIPLTTFVVMPLEALALTLDAVGAGAPIWWLCGRSLDVLLWIARTTANAPGAVAALPAMPRGAFGLMIGGGLWLLLWRTRARLAGAVPFVAGAIWALATPAPDLIVTGDGRHLAIRTSDGGLALLRERAGDYVRDMLAEGGGVDGDLPVLDEAPGARCNADLCLTTLRRGGRGLADDGDAQRVSGRCRAVHRGVPAGRHRRERAAIAQGVHADVAEAGPGVSKGVGRGQRKLRTHGRASGCRYVGGSSLGRSANGPAAAACWDGLAQAIRIAECRGGKPEAFDRRSKLTGLGGGLNALVALLGGSAKSRSRSR